MVGVRKVSPIVELNIFIFVLTRVVQVYNRLEETTGSREERDVRACFSKPFDFQRSATHSCIHRAATPRTSGAIFSAHDLEKAQHTVAAEAIEREARRNQKGNAHVFIDVSVNNGPACRIEFVLYHTISPLAAENFRQMCTGEMKDGKHTYKGAMFYRILDKFIDQSGPINSADSVYGGTFADDQGGGLYKMNPVDPYLEMKAPGFNH
jgi:hypothetical protein